MTNPGCRIMTTNHLIPAGRTSTVKRGDIVLQIQTEYAYRPLPRITTTVLNQGRVLHKIERSLDRAVETFDEQNRTEVIIKRQHSEVISILQGDTPISPFTAIDDTPAEPVAPVVPAPSPQVKIEPMAEEKLREIPGVTHVYTLDNEGNFFTNNSSDQFQQMFSPIFRNIRALIELFGREPGVGITREQGVVEIERDRLYFASSGNECYFVVVRRVNTVTDYENEIRMAVAPPEL
jgi:hypothetical protein